MIDAVIAGHCFLMKLIVILNCESIKWMCAVELFFVMMK